MLALEDAFRSITVYNANGYLEASTGGFITIRFGGCEDGWVNCVPVISGRNSAIRPYKPGREILEGEWTIPPPFAKLSAD